MNVDLVINRNARGLGETSAVRAALTRAAARSGVRVHETWTLDDLDGVVRSLSRRPPDAVVLAGGDGSHMAGASALHRVFGDATPRIVLAPGGTVNTVARGVGVRGRAGPWVERAMAAA
ncbi:MAG: diacylglycerol kinase family protein, partial [Polyangiaceae bacterium]